MKTAMKMNAIVATGYGSADVLECQRMAIPEPKATELLIRVYASSITRADTMMRTGTPYIGRLFTGLRKPKHAIPGTGFAGVVTAIGKDVTDYQPGDWVFGETTLGFSANAEFLSIDQSGVVLPLPVNLHFKEAATFCDGPLTSLNFLQEIGQLKAGQRVLINGASGSLGTAAVQLARYLGAEVTAVCSTRNVELAHRLGADNVIDYTKEDFTRSEKSYDLIFDTVGTSSFGRCKKVLSSNGVYLSPVLKAGLLVRSILTSISGSKRAKFAATGMKSDEELRILLAQLVEIYRGGHLKTIIEREFAMTEIRKAHRFVSSGRKS